MPTRPNPTRDGRPALPVLPACLLAALAVLAASPLRAAEVPAVKLANSKCLDNCHGLPELGTRSLQDRRSMLQPLPAGATPASGPARRPGLYVLAGGLTRGPHANIACTDCHQDIDASKLPHRQGLAPARCDGGACHVKPNADYAASSHRQARDQGKALAPICQSCHGGHDLLPKADRKSPTFRLNSAKLCGGCHEKFATLHGHDGKAYVQGYFDSIHGRLLTKGLTKVANCADCHGSHRVLPSVDAAGVENKGSTVSRTRVAGTCGECHDGENQAYQTSIHGTKAARGDTKAPVCTGCHSSHKIARTDLPGFMQDLVDECGHCHNAPRPGSSSKATLYETYRRSYHGQVSRLGAGKAAKCSSCHGSHDILPAKDPASRVNPANLLKTCRQCHENAGPMFAQFQPHADFRDRERYPILHAIWWYFIIMMSCAFGFFGLHSLLWLSRSIIEHFKRGPHPRHVAETHAIQRFNRVDRLNHFFVIVSFFGLTLTGLPLLYAEQAWGRYLADILGGPRACGLLHRVFAVMLIANFVVHFAGILRRFLKHGVRNLLFGPATMLPRWKDVTDCLNMFRWFFRGGKKPPFDRWTYWEKFDYMAEVGGSVIIGVTGLLLWFPQAFSHIVPGWAFNVATMIHGYEALLAIGFIFTIHFYNAHLRLEKFPVDDVIFTGRLPEEEFKHERGAEYERLQASGELDKLRVNVPAKGYHRLAIVVGVLAMTIGMTLVVLIILAGLNLI